MKVFGPSRCFHAMLLLHTKIEIGPKVATMRADLTKVRQTFFNLLSKEGLGVDGRSGRKLARTLKPIDWHRLNLALRKYRKDGQHPCVVIVEDEAHTREMLGRLNGQVAWTLQTSALSLQELVAQGRALACKSV
jgi:hypothetical protein